MFADEVKGRVGDRDLIRILLTDAREKGPVINAYLVPRPPNPLLQLPLQSHQNQRRPHHPPPPTRRLRYYRGHDKDLRPELRRTRTQGCRSGREWEIAHRLEADERILDKICAAEVTPLEGHQARVGGDPRAADEACSIVQAVSAEADIWATLVRLSQLWKNATCVSRRERVGLNFIGIRGPELLNKYIGQSEKSVKDIFDRVPAAKPCALFFDELDSIAPKRWHDSTGVTDRVVNPRWMVPRDSMESMPPLQRDLIDPALLRPGRLDEPLLCDLPGIEGRTDAILAAVSRNLTPAPSVDFDKLASIAEGFSGADLQAPACNAPPEVVHAAMDDEKLDDSGGGGVDAGRRRVGVGLSDEVPVKYTVLGIRKDASKAASKADETKMKQRLQEIRASKSGGMEADSRAAAAPERHEITQEHLLKVLKTTGPSVSREEQTCLRVIVSLYNLFCLDKTLNSQVQAPAATAGEDEGFEEFSILYLFNSINPSRSAVLAGISSVIKRNGEQASREWGTIYCRLGTLQFEGFLENAERRLLTMIVPGQPHPSISQTFTRKSYSRT
ncbi:hypothetical protein F4604DRAFT_1933280 [Suillus subluteus]|nr:hypothetical protein F4604DRAFT_1933280 [Suillus subluteus]